MESSADKEEEQKQPSGCIIYFASLPCASLCSSSPLSPAGMKLGVSLSHVFIRFCLFSLAFGCFVIIISGQICSLSLCVLCASAHTHTHTCQEACLLAVCFARILGRDILQGQSCVMKRAGGCSGCCCCSCCSRCRHPCRCLFYVLLILRDKMHPRWRKQIRLGWKTGESPEIERN